MSEWRKSSYSGTETDCVEVGRGIGVRDTKAPSQHMLLSAPAWSAFLTAVKSGSLSDAAQ